MSRGILKYILFSAWVAFNTSQVLGVGDDLTSLRMFRAQTEFIRHTATEYQRRVAEQNAKAFFKKLTPAKKEELKKKHIKTVLIATVRSAETSPQAKQVKMRYALEEESLVDNYVYEFKTPLQTGAIATVAGLDPEYVGQ